MPTIEEYANGLGRSPFSRWFNRLDARAAAKMGLFPLSRARERVSSIKPSTAERSSPSPIMSLADQFLRIHQIDDFLLWSVPQHYLAQKLAHGFIIVSFYKSQELVQHRL